LVATAHPAAARTSALATPAAKPAWGRRALVACLGNNRRSDEGHREKCSQNSSHKMNLSQPPGPTPEEVSQHTIRAAQNSDQPAIVQVISTVYAEYGFPWDEAGYNADLYDLEAHYFSPGHPLWVAEVGGQVVGTGALELFETIPGEEPGLTQIEDLLHIPGADCGLSRVYLLPEFRGRGLGKALTLTAIQAAQKLGRKRMEIWSDKRLTTAHALYQRLGAKMYGERLCNDPENAPEWGLVLDL
jgi:putative acetyltransferase